jgi:glycosyltransferase involved in cell wall biosynthesis
VFVGRETFAWTAPDLAHDRGVPVLQRLAGTVTWALIERRYPERLAADLYAKLARIEGLVTPAHHMAEAVMLLGLTRVSAIPTAVDLAHFRPAPRDPALARRFAIDPDDVVVAHVSTLKPVKRPRDLIESAALVLAADPRVVYLVVGDGELRPALEGRAGIRLVGRVPHEDVPRWIAAADVVCQPSLVEPFGLATLEAMASARSVVATRVGGPPEFVSPEAGILVDPTDEDALVHALDAAAALPRPNLAAREAAEAHDVRGRAARLEEILQAARDRRA